MCERSSAQEKSTVRLRRLERSQERKPHHSDTKSVTRDLCSASIVEFFRNRLEKSATLIIRFWL